MACADCFKGYVRTDKAPTGTVATVYGLPTYVARPPLSTPPKGVIVIVPDAFGWEFLNNRILADTYAAAGFRVYLPDFMNGAPAPLYFLDCIERFTSTASFWDWVYKPYDFFWLVVGLAPFVWTNWISKSHPRVVGFTEKLRTAPTTEDKGLKVGLAGFCWGGKHTIMLTHAKEAHLVDATFTAHPSALTLPGDIEGVTKPLSIAIGDKDNMLNPQQVRDAEKILKKLEGQIESMKSEVVVYPGAGHGFSVRIDVKNPKQVEQSEQAERQAINWFEKMFV